MRETARATVLVVLAILAILAIAGCSTRAARDAMSDAAGTTTPVEASVSDADNDLCQRACAVLADLPCSDRAGCSSACFAAFATGRCLDERRATLGCAVTNGSSAFVCSSGRIVTRPGYCVAEDRAFIACYAAPPDGGS